MVLFYNGKIILYQQLWNLQPAKIQNNLLAFLYTYEKFYEIYGFREIVTCSGVSIRLNTVIIFENCLILTRPLRNL